MHFIRSVVQDNEKVQSTETLSTSSDQDASNDENNKNIKDATANIDRNTSDRSGEDVNSETEADGSVNSAPESEAETTDNTEIGTGTEANDIDNQQEEIATETEGSEKKDSETADPQDSLEAANTDNNNDSTDEASGDEDEESNEAEDEAEAISLATKTADENYQPSQSNLSSSSPYPLIRSVDGISLKTYNIEPSRFSAKDVAVPLRGKLNVPIHVATSGSIVDYTVHCQDFDIGFGVIAEREEGVTIVKENSRQDCHLNAITGRFLVGSVPCALIFTFDNEFSWFREKKVSYKIKVSPPSIENIINGRRTRAKSALSVVHKDKESAEVRLESVSAKHGTLMQDIERLETELMEKKKSLGVVEKEEGWLKQRVQLRDVQESLLTRRLTEGWEDEALALGTNDEDDDEVHRAEI